MKDSPFAAVCHLLVCLRNLTFLLTFWVFKLSLKKLLTQVTIITLSRKIYILFGLTPQEIHSALQNSCLHHLNEWFWTFYNTLNRSFSPHQQGSITAHLHPPSTQIYTHPLSAARPHSSHLRAASPVYHPFIRGYERRSRIPDHSIMPVLKSREEIRAGNVQGRQIKRWMRCFDVSVRIDECAVVHSLIPILLKLFYQSDAK